MMVMTLIREVSDAQGAARCGQVALRRRDEGGKGADKFRRCVPHIAIADLDCVDSAFLHQLADQRLRADLCAAS